MSNKIFGVTLLVHPLYVISEIEKGIIYPDYKNYSVDEVGTLLTDKYVLEINKFDKSELIISIENCPTANIPIEYQAQIWNALADHSNYMIVSNTLRGLSKSNLHAYNKLGALELALKENPKTIYDSIKTMGEHTTGCVLYELIELYKLLNIDWSFDKIKTVFANHVGMDFPEGKTAENLRINYERFKTGNMIPIQLEHRIPLAQYQQLIEQER